MSDRAFGVDHPPASEGSLTYFDVEIHDGVSWMSLNDDYNFKLGAKSLDQVQQGRRRHSVSSPFYDGEWEVHSTLTNVQETLEVFVNGADQLIVTDNITRLKEAFSQSLYNVRISMDLDVQVWRCFPAEYVLKRGQVNAHNMRAEMTFSIPRFPKISHEVRQ